MFPTSPSLRHSPILERSSAPRRLPLEPLDKIFCFLAACVSLDLNIFAVLLPRVERTPISEQDVLSAVPLSTLGSVLGPSHHPFESGFLALEIVFQIPFLSPSFEKFIFPSFPPPFLSKVGPYKSSKDDERRRSVTLASPRGVCQFSLALPDLFLGTGHGDPQIRETTSPPVS